MLSESLKADWREIDDLERQAKTAFAELVAEATGNLPRTPLGKPGCPVLRVADAFNGMHRRALFGFAMSGGINA